MAWTVIARWRGAVLTPARWWMSIQARGLASTRVVEKAASRLTPSEALGALRQFYLAVHPDLFTRFPKEKAANEESLKQLNSYLDALKGSRRPHPLSLTFYIHPSGRGRRTGGSTHSLRVVDIRLSALSTGSVVHDILESCDLSNHISASIRAKLEEIRVSDEQGRLRVGLESEPRLSDIPDWEDAFMRSSARKEGPVYLDKWLKENLPLAKECLESSWPIREQNTALIQELCDDFNIQSISIDTEWTAVTIRGHLLSLQRLLQQESLLVGTLGTGVSIVLGYGSGVDIHGQLHLNCEQTMQQWMQLLPSARVLLEKARELATLEAQISGLWGGMSFERPSGVDIDVYHQWLRLWERECLQQLSHGGLDLEGFDGLTIMLTSPWQRHPSLCANAAVRVPVTYPLEGLASFLRHSQCEARKLKREYKRQQQATNEVLLRCKKTLKLAELERSSAISDPQVCQSCQKMLCLVAPAGLQCSSLLGLFTGHCFHLTTYYSMSTDGRLRIPWDFAISDHYY